MHKTICITTSRPHDGLVSYSYLPILHGYLSNVICDNNYCTTQNKFIYTGLCGGKCIKKGLFFEKNPYFYVRFSDADAYASFVTNLRDNKLYDIFDDVKVIGLSNVPDTSEKDVFRILAYSPLVTSENIQRIKGNLDDNDLSHLESYLIANVRERAEKHNIAIDPNLSIKVIAQFSTVLAHYRKIDKRCRVLDIAIEADDDTKEFIYSHGLGKSTSCGFGFIF